MSGYFNPIWLDKVKSKLRLSYIEYAEAQGSVDAEGNFVASGVVVEVGNYLEVSSGNALFDKAVQGEFGLIENYVPVEINIPKEISRRQCAKQMLSMKLISGAEALAMAKIGDMPSMVKQMISGLPLEQQIAIEIDFAADTYLRDNPLLNQLMQGAGNSERQIDEFFIAAATL